MVPAMQSLAEPAFDDPSGRVTELVRDRSESGSPAVRTRAGNLLADLESGQGPARAAHARDYRTVDRPQRRPVHRWVEPRTGTDSISHHRIYQPRRRRATGSRTDSSAAEGATERTASNSGRRPPPASIRGWPPGARAAENRGWSPTSTSRRERPGRTPRARDEEQNGFSTRRTPDVPGQPTREVYVKCHFRKVPVHGPSSGSTAATAPTTPVRLHTPVLPPRLRSRIHRRAPTVATDRTGAVGSHGRSVTASVPRVDADSGRGGPSHPGRSRPTGPDRFSTDRDGWLARTSVPVPGSGSGPPTPGERSRSPGGPRPDEPWPRERRGRPVGSAALHCPRPMLGTLAGPAQAIAPVRKTVRSDPSRSGRRR